MKGFAAHITTALVVIFGVCAHAVELLGRPAVVSAPDGVTITWKTDVACAARLSYGLDPARLDRKMEGPVATEHSIRLEGLSPGATYHYSIGSARVRLGGGAFNTAGDAPAAAPQPSIIRRVLSAVTPEKKARNAEGAPPAKLTWGRVETLQDHYDRHGRDFGSASPEEYAAQAWRFLRRAHLESLPMKLDAADGTLRVFDPRTRSFAAYDRAGRTKTFFKPQSPTYWQRQPGREVSPAQTRLAPRSE